ncbi:hypothetical protein Q8F55_000002 [Vanrija albida]|uniref:Zn(2)-C6 fungal-type domain-containing protein n=1 Tax=Vanrija albida TaxID=181172 RepID=A0ABR3QC04_9TREE
MQSEDTENTPRVAPQPPAAFRRVYRACENCRQKKHKCNLGDSANPTPPCSSCRRASQPCVLPPLKRKGRPPKRPRVDFESPPSSVVPPPSADAAWEDSSLFLDSEPLPRSVSPTPTPAPSIAPGSVSHTLETFPVRNTSDALRLLNQAGEKESPRSKQTNGGTLRSSVGISADYFLLREGMIELSTMSRLFSFFLGSVHPIMPLIPYDRIPITPDQLVSLGAKEPYLMSAILVVTAGLTGELTLHRKLWQRVQTLFAEVALQGTGASIDTVEGLLLLSEYPPNMGQRSGLQHEDRMCWMTLGIAIRLGYLLGLDQLAILNEDDDDMPAISRERGSVAWRYCYCLDRQISIQAGKAFWHRGPGMTYQHMHADPALDYPELTGIPGVQEDYASYLQCLMHLTQVLTNAHDLLYPSKSRSIALAKAEHYYKHIDDFTETLAAFRSQWKRKVWRTYPINECVWISFHHLRLYIYAFSLQAYMQRVRAQAGNARPINYFPTGMMGCSDARFIVEAVDAAADVLRLAIGRLHPSGAFSSLPLRYFLFFNHAGVFLLKASVIVPLPQSQKRTILHLVRTLTKNMSSASLDPNHPAVRYSSALRSLLGRVCRDQDLQSPGSTRPSSPRPRQASPVDQAHAYPDLSSILGSMETSFVPERPFHNVAAEMDLLLGLPPGDVSFNLTPTAAEGDLSGLLPPSDPFASFFSNEDGHLWEAISSTDMEWSAVNEEL